MKQVFVGLGSNLAEPIKQVQNALSAMAQIPGVRVVQTSSLYASKPMGPADQPDYTNAVVELETSLNCQALLRKLQAIELQQGRERKDERWGPRTLDLDILLYGDDIIEQPDLVVPHYGMKQREFVIYPLAEIAPTLILPDGEHLNDLFTTIPDNGIKRLPQKIGIQS